MSVSLVQAPTGFVARHSIELHSKSFALASRLLTKREREQTYVLYAWCRHVDDAIDESEREHAGEVLAHLRSELDDVYAGLPRAPMSIAVAEVVRDRAIPRLYPMELLAGMEMDLTQPVYGSVAELFIYAYRVAGVVGLMMSHVFGVRDTGALQHAAHLGIAMQLTNICRDVAEDWQRGRLYVPDELLARHGAAGLAAELGGPFPESARAAMSRSVAELLELADRYYRSATRGERALPWRAALGVRAARGVYSAIGDRVAARDYDVTAERAVVRNTTKLARVVKACAVTLAELPVRAFAKQPTIPASILEAHDVARL